MFELTATVPGDVAETVDAWFEARRGDCVVTIAEACDTPARFGEPGEPAPGIWDLCEVSVLVPEAGPGTTGAEPGHAELVAAASADLGIVFEITPLDSPDRDWEAHYRDQIEPLAFAGGLAVVPPWTEVDAPGARTLVLEPDQAFGSGRHPTTRMCLEALPGRVEGCRVMDYGAGSGILAMAAIRHGAWLADGIEIDPVAIECANRNAARNGLDDAVGFYLPEQAPSGQYDLVVANILLNPLVVLAPEIAARVMPAGRLLLTGILVEQRAALIAAYPDFAFEEIEVEAGWMLLEGRRDGD